MVELKGYVDHIIYKNNDNGYSVFVVVSDEEEITCVGISPQITEGMNVEVTGDYVEHPSYGTQVKISSLKECEPEDEIAIERYLGSGAIKGIGIAMAARIVRHFKKDTFRIIEEEPERLVEIKGISERKAREIAAQVCEKKELRSAMIFLGQYGISVALAVKIYNAYGQQIYSIIKENPYRLADDIKGVGFKIADDIAMKAGIKTDSDFRIKSGILYVLLLASGEGHTFLPADVLTERCKNLLEVDGEMIERLYMDLSIEKKIVVKGDNIYSSVFYAIESNVARMLIERNIDCNVPDSEIEKITSKVSKNSDLEQDEMQLLAMKEAIKNGVLVITGGPGTGKTTTINNIIKCFEHLGAEIMLAAPTGRAAKRMTEATGLEAKTIHRMLELNGAADGGDSDMSAGFARNEDYPLEADVVIVDEMSMVDITLMNALLKAIAPGTRLILVGDANQLPSVGPGCVLKDIIDSECFQVVRLSKIFRQASKSDIIVNAHKINKGEEVTLDNKSKDFFFLKRYDADKIINVTMQLVGEKLPGYVDAEPFDIQVLTPMRKGLLGVERLNKILQNYLNPPDKNKIEKEHGDGVLREGDKVMQIKNNYNLEWEIHGAYGIVIERGLGVFNGDMGIVKEINNFAALVTVEFEEGRTVEYPFANLEELELSYAITIHKSQGSEYPAVVIPVMDGPRMLMNRNLIYTAVTRARKCVTMVGDENTFFGMVQNATMLARYSGLKQRLNEMSIAI
ncbi:MAG: ATP-dependent RecD-like DNA helicase [Lachnospiraceae bacterium]|nr:ATP-dependent RecD-like DNA helicase [Lachnospiraceae bacterium]